MHARNYYTLRLHYTLNSPRSAQSIASTDGGSKRRGGCRRILLKSTYLYYILLQSFVMCMCSVRTHKESNDPRETQRRQILWLFFTLFFFAARQMFHYFVPLCIWSVANIIYRTKFFFRFLMISFSRNVVPAITAAAKRRGSPFLPEKAD